MASLTNIIQQFQSLLKEKSLSFVLKKDDLGGWEKVLKSTEYIPVDYTQANIQYQTEYQVSQGGLWQDVSTVIYWDNHPVGTWPLTFSIFNNRYNITSYGKEILSPIFIKNIPKKTEKKIVKICVSVIIKIAEINDVKSIIFKENFWANKGLSEWYKELMKIGASRIMREELYLNLAPSLDVIKKNFRDRYKSLINKGYKVWNSYLISEDDFETWEEYRKLHRYVAGKVTRSYNTWNLQFDHIKSKDAFLIYLRDENKIMVGGGFFNVSRDEGLYSVGAYIRELFDKPIGHVVQFNAIKEMKNRGIQWYKIGDKPYPGEEPNPTEKELSIANFKQGFASHSFPKILLSIKLN